MENKYYTPEISEFYVGFKYEYFNSACQCWLESSYETMYDQKSKPLDELHMEVTRVKYLDKEDIESLGWTKSNKNFFTISKYILLQGFNYNLEIMTYEGDVFFRGIIKNKSELKKLMKQLGIDG